VDPDLHDEQHEVSDERGAAERATFIVRLWRRSSRDEWRGHVEHVQSGERAAAPTLADALAQLRRWLGLERFG